MTAPLFMEGFMADHFSLRTYALFILALLAAMLVYVPGDTLKIIVVTALAPVLRRTLAKAVPNL